MPSQYSVFDLGLDNHLNRPFNLVAFNTENPTETVGAMAIVAPNSVPAGSISAGELPQTIFYAKQSYTDTTNGFRQGFDPTDGLYKWLIGNATNSIDWNVTTTNALTVIGAISASTIDIGGADATSFHVDVDGNMWLGAATFAAAPASISNAGVGTFTNITITGSSSSIAGNALVGSWTATSSSLTNTSGGNTVTLSTGATSIISGPTGSPTFSVTAAGAMTSTSGLIGAWTINASTLTGGDATLDPAGDLTLGTGNNLVRLSATDATYRLWAGHATASAAPFSVTQDGILRATNAEEIVLTVADTGNVVGLIVNQNDVTNNPVAVSITQNGTGDILNIFDGAVETFTVLGTGRVGIYQGTPTAVLEVVQTSALTTGNTLLVSRNLAAASTDSAVASIIQDHASDDQMALNIQQDGSGSGIEITTASTTNYGIAINATALTTGSIGRFYSNATDVSARNLVDIINDNTLATGAVVLRLQQDSTGSIFQAFDGATQIFTIADGGSVYINDTANANMTVGLTINQGAADNEILTFKSSDVGHAMTGITEADTYGLAVKASATLGGLGLWGFAATGISNSALRLDGATTDAADTTKSTAGHGVVVIRAMINNAGSVAVVGADGNLLSIESLNTTRFIFDAEGTFHTIASGGAHIGFLGDPTNSSPNDGDLTYTGTALNFYDGTRTRDLLSLLEQIAETTLGGAATSISLTSIPARTDLRVVFFLPSSSGSIDLRMTFNNDTAANYAWASREGGAAGGGNSGIAFIQLNANTRTWAQTMYVFDIINIGANQKLVRGYGYTAGATNNFGVEYIISGHWNNTADQINRIDISSSTASTLAAGTRITVSAKKD